MEKSRDNSIDIIKGLAIILMVYGHTFGMARDFIYLFHMPIFIFVSGYCYNKKHYDSLQAFESYFFSRVRRLLLPYLAYNIVFVLLTNVFLKLNFYTDKEAFKLAVVPIQKAAQGLTTHLGPRAMLNELYPVITLDSVPQMGSASWFIVVLFLVCVIHTFLGCLINHIFKNEKLRVAAWAIIFAIVLIITGLVSNGFFADMEMANRHSQIFEVYTCFLVAVAFRKLNLPQPKKIWQQLICIAITAAALTFMLRFGTLEMSKCAIINPGFLVAATIVGYYFMYAIAGLLSATPLARLFVFLGQHTLPILFLHILAFKFVSLGYVLFHHLPLYLVASWPVLFNVGDVTKLIYTAVGVALPALIMYALGRIKKF